MPRQGPHLTPYQPYDQQLIYQPQLDHHPYPPDEFPDHHGGRGGGEQPPPGLQGGHTQEGRGEARRRTTSAPLITALWGSSVLMGGS